MQHKQKLGFIVLGCALLLSGVVLLIDVLAQESQQAQIVFCVSQDRNYDIYVMDVDGENQRKLTKDPADDVYPSWSPDGQRIAFMRAIRDGSSGIYVMDADGANQRRLTNNPAIEMYPDWFDPAAYAVHPVGKLRGTWGWLKQNSKQESQKLF